MEMFTYSYCLHDFSVYLLYAYTLFIIMFSGIHILVSDTDDISENHFSNVFVITSTLVTRCTDAQLFDIQLYEYPI